jgi:hypothetical protein
VRKTCLCCTRAIICSDCTGTGQSSTRCRPARCARRLTARIAEAERIHLFLRFPDNSCAAIDRRIGDGVAFTALTCAVFVLRYGIELHAHRAEQARELIGDVLYGDALETQCSVESFSLLYLNLPYDRESGAGQNRRMEQIFLRHTHRWLQSGGVLVLVIPGECLAECGWHNHPARKGRLHKRADAGLCGRKDRNPEITSCVPLAIHTDRGRRKAL